MDVSGLNVHSRLAISPNEPVLCLTAHDPIALDVLAVYRQLLVFRGESVEWLDPVLEEFRLYQKESENGRRGSR